MMGLMKLRVGLAGTKRKLNLKNTDQIINDVDGNLTVTFQDKTLADVVVPAGRWTKVERINE